MLRGSQHQATSPWQAGLWDPLLTHLCQKRGKANNFLSPKTVYVCKRANMKAGEMGKMGTRDGKKRAELFQMNLKPADRREESKA